ncbi:hypothetical protein RHSIM_Rhsim07G0163300 [Rhododendron simsii]|uniref:Cytochrome b561, DM13 and DOMON domain-containing protein n=1 Tax=Rhododendron simsii TaxID=118357 RepID=A0A834LJ38_RHOSS|nr:hypothetical protein RHSIM_Rhsim07G0163300 [Rhododendron simsii]
MAGAPPLLLLGFLFHCFLSCHACLNSTNTSLTNFQSDFVMLQHQLRGVFQLIDACSFRVTRFDMLPGSDVRWWGSIGDDFANLTNGFVISDMKLNRTYKNDSFVVNLNNNVSWDQIRVVSVWDIPNASDFGYVVLVNDARNGSEDFAPSPSPAAVGGGGGNNGSSNSSSVVGIFKEPTMFENCKVLSSSYRVRWTLEVEEGLIDIGLEAATGIQNYMAFGWANPNSTSKPMLGADVTVTGFTEDNGMSFADDFYISQYTECVKDEDGKVQGVCPDSMYEGLNAANTLVNNSVLVYGHRKDGVSFVRYQRPLNSDDKKFDLPVNPLDNMTVIWAMGLLKPPDSLHPYYLPENHGETYGYLTLNVSDHVNDCLGPLDAEDKDDQDLITADRNAPLVVTVGPAVYYPNPPNPSKVIYINKKEAPVLRVERGVPVKFSIQAGHDVAFYVTSDPLGGNATLRNKSETIYAGGPAAEGVPASPMVLNWAPDRNTPDQVYYQSVFTEKMGWKIQVVDGGLSDMYNNSVVLDDQQVTLFWTLSENSISFAARGEKKSSYLAIGFGSGMVNSFAYVGWVDDDGKGHVNTYWIDAQEASGIHPTYENLTYVRCRSENGIMTLEFTRPLNPSCHGGERPECKNIIDPTTPLKIIWAMGARWSDDNLSERNMHSAASSRPVRVFLKRGSAEALEDLRPVLAVHGFMMFLAWGILLPGGILAARYLKHVKGDGWYQLHVYLQYSGLAIVLLGFLFAVAELQGLHFDSVHVKFGMAAIFLACVQPVNAYMRPKKPANGEEVSSKRLVWEYAHFITGRSAIVVGFVALVTGMKHLGDRYGGENVRGLNWALIGWFFIGALLVIYLENCEKKRRRDTVFGRSDWVLGNSEEEDTDLLSPSRAFAEKELDSSDRMEVQLEPMSR